MIAVEIADRDDALRARAARNAQPPGISAPSGEQEPDQSLSIGTPRQTAPQRALARGFVKQRPDVQCVDDGRRSHCDAFASSLPCPDHRWPRSRAPRRPPAVNVQLSNFKFTPKTIVLDHGRPYVLRLANAAAAAMTSPRRHFSRPQQSRPRTGAGSRGRGRGAARPGPRNPSDRPRRRAATSSNARTASTRCSA